MSSAWRCISACVPFPSIQDSALHSFLRQQTNPLTNNRKQAAYIDSPKHDMDRRGRSPSPESIMWLNASPVSSPMRKNSEMGSGKRAQNTQLVFYGEFPALLTNEVAMDRCCSSRASQMTKCDENNTRIGCASNKGKSFDYFDARRRPWQENCGLYFSPSASTRGGVGAAG